MSVIVSTAEQINRSPLNTSPSKQRFSFPRALRFCTSKRPNTGVVGYNLPSTLHTRATSLGKGSRKNIVNISASPPPNAYNLRGTFEQCFKRKKGFTFGASRISYDKVFVKESPFKDPCSPGPGEYSGVRPRFGANANSFSMRPRTSVQNWRPGRDSPGPCGYKIVDGISATGKYPISKYHNFGSFIISSSKEGRFTKQIKNPSPGPGQYNPKDSLDPRGAYFVSKFRSTQT